MCYFYINSSSAFSVWAHENETVLLGVNTIEKCKYMHQNRVEALINKVGTHVAQRKLLQIF